jgi:hypothetical protein
MKETLKYENLKNTILVDFPVIIAESKWDEEDGASMWGESLGEYLVVQIESNNEKLAKEIFERVNEYYCNGDERVKNCIFKEVYWLLWESQLLYDFGLKYICSEALKGFEEHGPMKYGGQGAR